MSEDRISTSARADDGDIARRYKHLRVVDVVDAMDGMGYFNVGLMDSEVRPLWQGMKFWGVAYTQRCVPAARPMWKLDTTEEIVNAHSIWFRATGGEHIGPPYQPGHVLVTDCGGGPEAGFWGSLNSLDAVAQGVVGIVTDGFARDTAELALQRSPVCCRKRGRTITPGRMALLESQVPVACGGVQVRPGDIVGCDDDGIVVVPRQIAQEVAVHAAAVLLADMKARRKLYERIAMPFDDSVDVEKIETCFRGLGMLT